MNTEHELVASLTRVFDVDLDTITNGTTGRVLLQAVVTHPYRPRTVAVAPPILATAAAVVALAGVTGAITAHTQHRPAASGAVPSATSSKVVQLSDIGYTVDFSGSSTAHEGPSAEPSANRPHYPSTTGLALLETSQVAGWHSNGTLDSTRPELGSCFTYSGSDPLDPVQPGDSICLALTDRHHTLTITQLRSTNSRAQATVAARHVSLDRVAQMFPEGTGDYGILLDPIAIQRALDS